MPAEQKLQEARRHLRQLWDSEPGVQGPAPRAQASPLNKVAASSSQNATPQCTSVLTVPQLPLTSASSTSNTHLHIQYAMSSRKACRDSPFPLGSLLERSMASIGVFELGLPSTRRGQGFPPANADALSLNSAPTMLGPSGCVGTVGLSQAPESLGLSIEQIRLK